MNTFKSLCSARSRDSIMGMFLRICILTPIQSFYTQHKRHLEDISTTTQLIYTFLNPATEDEMC